MNDTYSRSRVVEALWWVYGRGTGRKSVPQPFLTRVRKLGELGVPIAPEDRPGRKGVEIPYSPYQAFEIGVGLSLLDSGLKQAEVAYLLCHTRYELQQVYRGIMASPPAGRDTFHSSDRPGSPTQLFVPGADANGLGNELRRQCADLSVFMSFRSVTLAETMRPNKSTSTDPLWTGGGEAPVIFGPRFHRGLTELAVELEDMAWNARDNIKIVIELSQLATQLNYMLNSKVLTPDPHEITTNAD